MKAFIHIMLAVAFTAVVSVSVFADKDKVKKEIRLADDTTVNGTMVKAGDYELTFDTQTNEISIMRGSKVVAKAPVHVETQNTKAERTEYTVVSNEMMSVTLGGTTKQLVLSNSGASGSQ